MDAFVRKRWMIEMLAQRIGRAHLSFKTAWLWPLVSGGGDVLYHALSSNDWVRADCIHKLIHDAAVQQKAAVLFVMAGGETLVQNSKVLFMQWF